MERGRKTTAMKLMALHFLAMTLLFHCQSIHDTHNRDAEKQINRVQNDSEDSVFNYNGATVLTRFKSLPGYRRTVTEAGSFGSFLRNLPLKPHGTNVLLYDGSIKAGDGMHCAVVNMDIGDKNLQQCADAIIRLRAEYFFARNQFSKIRFHFTNGELADYVNYAEGYRVRDIDHTVQWAKIAQRDYSYDTFLHYLEMVFTYAGSYSLSRELIPVEDMEIGDVFIQGGFPGHAVIVVDMILNETTGDKQFLLAQSYMPAQEIHLLVNPQADSPWYPLVSSGKLVTPEWIFDYDDLKRFVGE
jgi:hypothetical protein